MAYGNLTGGIAAEDAEILKNDLESSVVLNLIINSFPDNLFIFDKDGLILDYKTKDTDILQYNPIEVLNKNIKYFLAPDISKKFTAGFLKIISGTPVVKFECSIFIGGKNKIFEIKLLPLINEKIIGIFKDITEKRETEKIFNELWENSSDGLLLIQDKTIIKANRAFTEISGLAFGEIIGKHISDLILKPEKENCETQDIDIISDAGMDIVSKELTFISNKTAELEVSYSFVDHNSNETVLGIYREAGIHHNYDEKYLLLEKFAILGKYSTYIAHEIKTSLASIKMCLDVFRDDFTATKRLHKIYELFMGETNRLNKLSRTILQFARPSEFIHIAINIKSFFDKINEINSIRFAKKNIEFINNCPPVHINGDYAKLQSAFTNMIDNSVESINENGTIEVSLAINQEKNKISIFLKDNGKGLKEPEKLFEPYYTSKANGTGLGLAIAKRNIEEHKGIVKLVSSLQGNTMFEVQLPYEGNNG
jgi:PAS domain S-box-containing protein